MSRGRQKGLGIVVVEVSLEVPQEIMPCAQRTDSHEVRHRDPCWLCSSVLEKFSYAGTCPEEVCPICSGGGGGRNNDAPAEVWAVAAMGELIVAIKEGSTQQIYSLGTKIFWPSTDAAVGSELDRASTST